MKRTETAYVDGPGNVFAVAAMAGRSSLNVATLLAALEFAADNHRHPKHKGAEGAPYVNHLIAVTHFLAAEGGIDNDAALVAAVLHDTVEDTTPHSTN